MGKLTWQQLGLIYEGSFNVDPTEAAQIISDHIFTKGWTGTDDKPGRMWQDEFTIAAFLFFLNEVDKYGKKNNLKFTKAVQRMVMEEHKQYQLFITFAKLTKVSPKRFSNLVAMWKKLPFVKKKPKVYSESYLKAQREAAKTLEKSIELNKKIELLKKKKPSIYTHRRK